MAQPNKTHKPQKSHTKLTSKPPFYRRKMFLWPVGGLLAFIIIVMLAFRFSPWPGALVIRTVFNRNGNKTLQAMQQKLPSYPVRVLHDQQYRPGDKAARLDVYIPKYPPANAKLPVVIWTHGGAWLSGDKKDAAPYYARLADQGFIVVAVDYSLAPNKKYPTAVFELNDAYGYVHSHAASYGGDAAKIVLAGDSAGAQLSSQMAAIITSSAYAKEMNIRPTLPAADLSGVVLFCGIYKMEGLTEPNPTLPKIVSWGDDESVWAYTGTRNKATPLIHQMSAYYHVTKDFPTTFISGGNADPLTKAQSMPLAAKLTGLGVPTTTLFYPDNHTPALPHEYQFTFNADGEKAFQSTLQFIQQATR